MILFLYHCALFNDWEPSRENVYSPYAGSGIYVVESGKLQTLTDDDTLKEFDGKTKEELYTYLEELI